MFVTYVRIVVFCASFMSAVNAASTPVKWENLSCLHEPITEEIAKGFYRKHFGEQEKRSQEAHGRMFRETGNGLLKERFDIEIFRERLIGLIYVDMSPLTDLNQLFDEEVRDAYGPLLGRMVRRGDCAGVDYALSKMNLADVQEIKSSLSCECRNRCMTELLLNRGVVFDLFDQFPGWEGKPMGSIDELLLERGADINKCSERTGLNPLLARINYTHSVYCCAGWLGKEELADMFGNQTGDLYVLVNAGVARHDRISEASAKKCQHTGYEKLIGKTAAEFLRYTSLVQDAVPGFEEAADYIDHFGITSQERFIRSVILTARKACNGDDVALARAALAQVDALPDMLKSHPEALAIFERCIGELWPIIEPQS